MGHITNLGQTSRANSAKESVRSVASSRKSSAKKNSTAGATSQASSASNPSGDIPDSSSELNVANGSVDSQISLQTQKQEDAVASKEISRPQSAKTTLTAEKDSSQNNSAKSSRASSAKSERRE